jgi:prepilin-type N-terminal cleavage/methylation domain-containing protein
MTCHRRTQAPRKPRGITLLEVLIAIGILAIGLASVVALVPAGHSQAARAVVLDRASILAANVLADAATFGLFRSVGVSNGASRPLVIDAAATSLPGAANGDLGSLGIYATAAPAAGVPAACENLFLQLRDDITVTATAGPDDLPTNLFVDGVRSFEGRMSALLCLQAGPAGGPELASVVVFHRRNTSFRTLAGTLTSGTLVIPSSEAAALGGRLVPDVIKPGVVVYTNPPIGFHQVTSAWIDTIAPVTTTATGTYRALMTFSTGINITSSTTPVGLTFLPDSVGLAERPFVAETAGAYTQ